MLWVYQVRGTSMTEVDLPVEAGGLQRHAASFIERATGIIAVLGGLLVMTVALLVVASVTLRFFFNAPIDGDFEFVKMATAIAIFAFLPYTQARRANIMVDTFTGWLPASLRRLLDGMWDLAYAGLMAYVGYALINGTLDAIKSGETTMQRQLLIWPSIAISTALCLLLVVTALVSAVLIMSRPGRTSS